MPNKVKRGLGLLVVAVLALIVGNFVLTIDTDRGAGQNAQAVFVAVVGIAMFACFITGLVLIAWGLLRD